MKPAAHQATWPRTEVPFHFPAEKLHSRLSVNRLSLVRRQPGRRQVIDGTAAPPVINTAPRLNKADSFVPITFEPLKPSVNCICLQAKVYSRLSAKSGLICRDNSNILQTPGRHEGLLPTLPGLPRLASQACRQHLPLTTQQVLPGKHKKQGARSNTEAGTVTPTLLPALCGPQQSHLPAPLPGRFCFIPREGHAHSPETWSTRFWRTVHTSGQAT